MKCKKILALTLVFSLLLAIIPFGCFIVSAEEFEEGYYTYTVLNGEATITGCDSQISGDVIIPSTLGGYPVTSIGEYAFSYGLPDNFINITVPFGVKIISNNAFYNRHSLKSIKISDSVTIIGDMAFYCCKNLENIEIGKGVNKIGDDAFFGCDKLNDILIPDGVTSIGEASFLGCKQLKNIIIGTGVDSIGERAFSDCESLVEIKVLSDNKNYTSEKGVLFDKCQKKLIHYPVGIIDHSYTIPSSVNTIGKFAFADCINLNNITIPNGVTIIDEYSFSNCTKLKNITLPNSVTTISDYAFENCTSFTSLTVPCGVINIGDMAFSNCTSVKNIKISDGVKNIGNATFNNCIALKNVVIPSSVEKIASNAFMGCNGLISINVLSDNNKFISEDGVLFNKEKNKLLVYPQGKDNIYYIVNDNTKYISSSAFSGVSLERITIPNSVNTIGYEAFAWCDNLRVVYFKGTKSEWNKIEIVTDSWGDTGNDSLLNATVYYNSCNDKATHTYKTITTKASLTKNGSIVKKCTLCGKIVNNTPIKYVKTIKLSTTSYTYNGKAKTPSVTVKDSSGKVLKKNTDYTVNYSNNKSVGKATVKVTFKGKYKGTKTLTFKINPAGTTVKSLNAGKKSLKVAIAKKTTQVTGYQIQYATNKSFKSAKSKNVTSYKTTSVTLKGLSAKKTYYVRVRTFKTVKGVKYYSAWSTVKYKKTK